MAKSFLFCFADPKREIFAIFGQRSTSGLFTCKSRALQHSKDCHAEIDSLSYLQNVSFIRYTICENQWVIYIKNESLGPNWISEFLNKKSALGRRKGLKMSLLRWKRHRKRQLLTRWHHKVFSILSYWTDRREFTRKQRKVRQI